MKRSQSLARTFLAAFACLLIGGSTGYTQGMGGNPSQAVSKALSKLFGANASFTADSEVEVDGPQKATMAMSLSFHQGKTRTEIDLTKMKSDSLPPGAAEQMKAMGMDRVISISDDKSPTAIIIFPGMKSYVAMTNSAAGTDTAEPKIEETNLGKETVGGKEMVKQKVTITEAGGKSSELTVWRAAAGEFPAAVEFNESGTKAKMKFMNVVKKTPDASLFTVPKDFEKFDSPQAMMMKKMMEKAGQ
jgi:hypothetical protein